MQFLQKIGKSLMLPIASLPVAALLLRLGVYFSGDLTSAPDFVVAIGKIILSAGDSLFSNLGLIFAVGVAIGFSKDQHGSAALAAVIGFLVTFGVLGAVFKLTHPNDLANTALDSAKTLADYKKISAAQISLYNIPGLDMKGYGGATILPGIIIGIIAGGTYNKFKDIKLHQSLSFFGGRRFVPLMTSIFAIFLGIVLAFALPIFKDGVEAIAKFVNNTRPFGLFVYGFANRLLIPTGLHHVFNTFFWFVTGHCASDATVTGDINMFLKHCKPAAGFATPGSFQSGFFPIMMFGLPGAALAMARSAKPENRKKVMGIMLGVAGVSFMTGVTEPIEFSFMFASPVLYFVHAVLTGLSFVVVNLLGVFHGFGFSAGLFDYLLNFKIGTNPILIIPIGLVFGAVYYFVFMFMIKRFNILTPGREDESSDSVTEDSDETLSENADDKAKAYYEAVGGSENVVEVNNCTTRLRLVLKDTSIVKESKIKLLGAMGQVKVDDKNYQIIIGPEVEFLADDMRKVHNSSK